MPRRQKNKKYSGELKLKAVQDYLKGGGSLRDICHKYKIKNEKSLREWILWYNGHREFKERSSAKGEIYMTKGRKTDFLKHSSEIKKQRCYCKKTAETGEGWSLTGVRQENTYLAIQYIHESGNIAIEKTV